MGVCQRHVDAVCKSLKLYLSPNILIMTMMIQTVTAPTDTMRDVIRNGKGDTVRCSYIRCAEGFPSRVAVKDIVKEWRELTQPSLTESCYSDARTCALALRRVNVFTVIMFRRNTK